MFSYPDHFDYFAVAGNVRQDLVHHLSVSIRGSVFIGPTWNRAFFRLITNHFKSVTSVHLRYTLPRSSISPIENHIRDALDLFWFIDALSWTPLLPYEATVMVLRATTPIDAAARRALAEKMRDEGSVALLPSQDDAPRKLWMEEHTYGLLPRL